MQPVYVSIHDVIKQQIKAGAWAIGSRLPSERDLADEFGVSRMTLRHAITLLVDEGVLERRVGSGTYVASRRVQEKMRGTTSFTEIVTSQGKKASSRLISYQRRPVSETEMYQLALAAEAHVVRMERVRYADNLPVVYEVASIPEDLVLGVDKKAVTEHFFQTLIDSGHTIGKSQQIISAKTASDRVAKYLGIQKGHAVLALTQVSYFTDGRPFEYVRSQYVGDRFEFYLENH